MRGEGVTMDERESSVRWIMTAEGYQPEQIEEYVNIMRDAGNPQPNPKQKPLPLRTTSSTPVLSSRWPSSSRL